MKNYYDELEVSKKASKEVIEKAYRVLAKKYHPDSTNLDDKSASEEKFKAITEAYNTLSDDFKRKEYDEELEDAFPNISYEEYEYVLNKNKDLEDEIDYLHEKINGNSYSGDSQSTVRSYYNRFTDSFVNPHSSSHGRNTETSRTRYSDGQTYENDKSPKRTFYYSDSGKPASAFDYYVYRIKTVGSNFFFGLLVFIAFLLLIRGILLITFSGKNSNNTTNEVQNNETQNATTNDVQDNTNSINNVNINSILTNETLNTLNDSSFLKEILNYLNTPRQNVLK